MLDFLDNLRQRPLYVRRYIALGTTTALSLLIFSIWASSWGVKDVLPENTYTKTESPIAVVVQKTTDARVSLGAALVNVREQFTQITATVASSMKQEETVYQPNSVPEVATEDAPAQEELLKNN